MARIEQVSWGEIPADLHLSFAKYICLDAWTGQPDLLSLLEAALMIIRDAITRTGEFGGEEEICAGHPEE